MNPATAEWHASVYKSYAELLLDKYPLNTNAQDEAAVLDFTSFFKAGGAVDTFLISYVAPFVAARDSIKLKSTDSAVTFSRGFLRPIQKAKLIRSIFFKTILIRFHWVLMLSQLSLVKKKRTSLLNSAMSVSRIALA